MPGIVRNYTEGSIIYFIGDLGNDIYVLKSGAVSLEFHSIETGEVTRETIKNGEFFGVKSALARRPREETAHVIRDSQVLVMKTDEFERLVIKNINIINNFLRVFSNQLRRVGKLTQSLLDHQAVGDNEAELFQIGEYYLKNHKYKQASYVYNTYLKHYSAGRYAPQAQERLNAVKDTLEGKGTGTYTSITKEAEGPGAEGPVAEGPVARGPGGEVDKGEGGKEAIDVATKYYDAVSLFSQEKYDEAYKLFKSLHSSEMLDESANEYIPKIEFEMGRCLIALKKYQDAVIIFTNLIKNYPKDENLKESLFNIGVAYKQQGNKEKAVLFFNKVLKMLPEGPVDRKAKKEIASIKSGK